MARAYRSVNAAPRKMAAASRSRQEPMIRSVPGLVLALMLAACASTPEPDGIGARIVEPDSPLQCVVYARSASNVWLRGDAWTWWDAADGKYAKSSVPRPGSVLVLKRNGDSLGHVAVVRSVDGSRVIRVDHANWLNQGRIHENTPVLDESVANDWSLVRFWYTPSAHWGGRVYAAHGFIHPDRVAALPSGTTSQ